MGLCRTVILTTIPAALGALSGGCSAPAPFRVMSFNIRYGTADDGPNRWEARRALAFQTIRDQQPDVLGLQEVLAPQAAELREALPDYGFVGVGRDDGREKGEFVPIFYRKSKFTLVDSGHFWFSETPERPGSVGWDAALPRMATWVRLRFKDALFADLTVVNLHLDHEGEKARVESAKMLSRLVESLGGKPVIVLGDFNCAPGSAPYQALLRDCGSAAALTDTQPNDKVPGVGGTYHAFTGRPRGGRIDWILINRRCKAVDADVDRRQHDGRYPSDHFPVTATVRLAAVAAGT